MDQEKLAESLVSNNSAPVSKDIDEDKIAEGLMANTPPMQETVKAATTPPADNSADLATISNAFEDTNPPADTHPEDGYLSGADNSEETKAQAKADIITGKPLQYMFKDLGDNASDTDKVQFIMGRIVRNPNIYSVDANGKATIDPAKVDEVLKTLPAKYRPTGPQINLTGQALANDIAGYGYTYMISLDFGLH